MVTFSVRLALLISVKLILLFSLFFVLFMGLITLFDTIHEFHCIISANFFSNFNKTNGSQIDP